MKFVVYVPQKLHISDSDLPAILERARKRHHIKEGKEVPLRHIVEEARRAGLIELNTDYCVDLDFEEEAPTGDRGRQKSNKNNHQRPQKGRNEHGHQASA